MCVWKFGEKKPSYGIYEDNQDTPRNWGIAWRMNFDTKTLIGVLSLNVAILNCKVLRNLELIVMT